MICRGGKVWVPEAMLPEILAMYHDDRGHFGVKRTVQMIQKSFGFPRSLELYQSTLGSVILTEGWRQTPGHPKAFT